MGGINFIAWLPKKIALKVIFIGNNGYYVM